MNCPACHDLLLDFLYDLLDESQAIAIREHVAACPACASELEKAKSDQLKLGRAALAIVQVPEFEVPEAAPAETSPAPADAPAPNPAAAPAGGRRAWPTTLAAALVALACCALVALMFGWRQHQEAVSGQVGRVAQLNQEKLDITTQLAALDTSFVKQQQAYRAAADRSGVQLHVSGPGRGVPQVSAPITVALADLEGKPVAGAVNVEFVDAQNQTLARTSLDVKGAADVPMPKELAETNQNVRVRFAAHVAGKEVARLEQSIAPPPHERAAHLAVNKLVYKAGDRVLVRALVLDRATLKPVPDGANVRAAIVTETGQDVVASPLLTAVAGIASGDLALPAEAGGDYFVEIRGDDLLPVRRRIEVLPAAAPSIDVLANQNNRYPANKAIGIQIQAFNADGSPAANSSVTGSGSYLRNNYLPNDRQDRNFDQSKQVVEFKERTDKDGKFNVVLPPIRELANGQQAVEFNVAVGEARAGDAKKDTARARYVLQVQPTRVAVDFYPEGGMLVAGTPNRVFFSIRAAEGDAPASARIAIRAGDKTVYRSFAEESLGVFSVTPKEGAKEGITVQFLSPKQADQRVSYGEIGIASGGVVIRGLGVQTGGGPVRLSLENLGEPRLVQLVVTCRSEVVAHRRLELKGEPQTLDLPVTVDGVLRVTAFHVKGGDLVPLAERLIYRAPVRRLDLDVQLGAKLKAPLPPEGGPLNLDLEAKRKAAPPPESDNFADAAGRTDGPLHLNIRGKNEAGDALPFWALASIVDDRFLDGPEPSLSAHFLLLGDDADWSDSPLLGLDSYRPALENALGVFGWRRFTAPPARPAGAPQATAKALADKANAGAGNHENRQDAGEGWKASAPTATFFYRVAPGLPELRQKLEDDWNIAQLTLTSASKARQAELLRRDESVRNTLASAQRELQTLEELPRERFMVALGVVTFGLMVLGSLAIVFGLVQLARRSTASPAFCLAAGCLAGCLAILMFRPEAPPTHRIEIAQLPAPSDFPKAERPDLPGGPGARSLESGKAQLAPKPRQGVEQAALDDRAKGKADPRAYLAQMPTEELARNDQKKGSLRQILVETEQQRMSAPNTRGVTLQKFAATAPTATPDYGGLGGGIGGGFGGGFGNAARPGGVPQNTVQAPPQAPPQQQPDPQAPQPPLQGPGGGVAAPASVPSGPNPFAAKVADAKKVAEKGAQTKADQVQVQRIQPAADSVEPNRDEFVDVNRLLEKLSEHRTVDLNQLKRQFASRRSQDVPDPVTVLWVPALSVPAAGTSLPLDLPFGPPRFRVMVFGHTDDGRLGLYDGVLEITAERK